MSRVVESFVWGFFSIDYFIEFLFSLLFKCSVSPIIVFKANACRMSRALEAFRLKKRLMLVLSFLFYFYNFYFYRSRNLGHFQL